MQHNTDEQRSLGTKHWHVKSENSEHYGSEGSEMEPFLVKRRHIVNCWTHHRLLAGGLGAGFGAGFGTARCEGMRASSTESLVKYNELKNAPPKSTVPTLTTPTPGVAWP